MTLGYLSLLKTAVKALPLRGTRSIPSALGLTLVAYVQLVHEPLIAPRFNPMTADRAFRIVILEALGIRSVTFASGRTPVVSFSDECTKHKYISPNAGQ